MKTLMKNKQNSPFTFSNDDDFDLFSQPNETELSTWADQLAD
jgi:hypothetical protein